jgi:hypothetical protein
VICRSASGRCGSRCRPFFTQDNRRASCREDGRRESHWSRCHQAPGSMAFLGMPLWHPPRSKSGLRPVHVAGGHPGLGVGPTAPEAVDVVPTGPHGRRRGPSGQDKKGVEA